MEKMDTLVKTGPDGLLDVTVSSLGLRKDITPDVVMGCEVTIADTEFYIREELELFEYPSKSLTYELSPLMYCFLFRIEIKVHQFV